MSNREIDILKFELYNYDVQIARKRIRLVERLIHLKKFLSTIINPNELEEIFYNILLIKLLDDRHFIRIQTTTIIDTQEFKNCILNFNNKYHILSNLLLDISDENLSVIIRELQKFDFYELELGKEPKSKNNNIKVDQELEQFIFEKKLSTKYAETKLIECLRINKSNSIYCNTLELELFAYIFFTDSYPKKISFDTRNINIVKGLCLGLFYNLLNKLESILNIIEINQPLDLNEHDILILENETPLQDQFLETKENKKILITNIKNHFLSNKILNSIINFFGVIFNIDYQTINNNGNIIRKNGLIAQRFFNHRFKAINYFSNLPLHILESKYSKNLQVNTISLTINCLEKNEDFDPKYYGGLKKEVTQTKLIDPIDIFPNDNNLLVDKTILEEIDFLFDLAKYDEFNKIIESSKYKNSFMGIAPQHYNFYIGKIELNLPKKQEILNANVLNPLFYRKEFFDKKLEITKQKHYLSSDIINSIFLGKDYKGDPLYSDDQFIQKADYIPIITEEVIRFGNFPDITKAQVIEKKFISLLSQNFIHENDILIAFKIADEKNKIALAWCIAPSIFNNSLPDKNLIVIRLNNISITPYDYVEYLNYLNSNNILFQITELIDISYLNEKFEENCFYFIKSFFENLPFPETIKDEYELTSWLKQKICDIYFDLLNLESKNLSNLFNYTLNENYQNRFPLVHIWQKEYIDFLWEYNNKPQKIILVSDFRAEKHKEILLEYLSTIDIVINNITYKNSNLKIAIKSLLYNKIEIIKNNFISEDTINKICVIFTDNAELLKYQYDNIKNLNLFKSIYLVYSKEQITNEIFDNTYNEILLLLKEKGIEIKERVKLIDINSSFNNPFQLEKKFLSSLFTFNELSINTGNRYNFFSRFSNLLKEYADKIISYHKYYGQSAFFFLESNHFAKKAMEIKIEENKELAKKAEWESLIDQLAHSLNTNIGASKNSISLLDIQLNNKNDIEKYISDISRFEKYMQDRQIFKYIDRSMKYLKEVSDLIELFLSNIKDISKNIGFINLSDIIKEQIRLIIDGIETLRFSNQTHKSNVKNLKPVLELDDTITIETSKSICSLIIKDLLKNSFLNTNQDSPYVKIKTMMIDDNYCLFQIENNKVMSEEWEKLINENIEEQSIKMSKSQHLGIKVILRCNERLNWNMKVYPDRINNFTTTKVFIPIRWKSLKF